MMAGGGRAGGGVWWQEATLGERDAGGIQGKNMLQGKNIRCRQGDLFRGRIRCRGRRSDGGLRIPTFMICVDTVCVVTTSCGLRGTT